MKIIQKFYYIINYRPLVGYKDELFSIGKLYCKNFFLFFLFLDYISKNKKSKVGFRIIKKKNSYSFLRSPNRNKKSQIKIYFVRYRISFNFVNYYNFLIGVDLNNFILFLNFIFKFYLFFETSFFFLEKKFLVVSGAFKVFEL